MPVITARQLVKLGACKKQVALFRKTFGASVEITEDVCAKHAMKFKWWWAALELLTTRGLEKWSALRSRACGTPSYFNKPSIEIRKDQARTFARLYIAENK